ncbi:MAG: exonuclease domain-containing protein [Alphaproteobacteria bacterium]|nr:exonuclease domain-containing protein [Alphaproteobacteria bacterium]
MPDTAIIFDCEFLCLEGSQRRYWCAPVDPDPVIAQIGAVRLSLRGEHEIVDRVRIYVQPMDRYGNAYEIPPFFTALTGITSDHIAQQGVSLASALAHLERFAAGAQLWSWGKDELNMMAISCYVAGVAPSIPAKRFDNACKLFLRAGMPEQDLAKTRSNELCRYFGIDHPTLRGHDALDDALSVTYALQHLLKARKSRPEHFEPAI